MLQGCGFESSMMGTVMVNDITKKIELFSKKIGSINDLKPTEVLSYLKAASELYPLATKLREMAETDAVCGVEKMLKEVNNILRKLIEETECAEDAFGSLEIPSGSPAKYWSTECSKDAFAGDEISSESFTEDWLV